MQLIDAVFIILIILVIANMAYALYKEYYQKPSTTTTTTITCLPVELPEITGKKISSGDDLGLLHPTEIELNPDLLSNKGPAYDSLEKRTYEKPKRDLPMTEQASLESAIAEVFPEPPKATGKIFTFYDSEAAENRKYNPVQRRTVLGQQERDGYQ
jgi:hypothetical protein